MGIPAHRGRPPEAVPLVGAGSGSLRLRLVTGPAGVSPLPGPPPLAGEDQGGGGEKYRGGAPRGERPDRKGRETPRKRLDVLRKHVKVPRKHLRLSALR